MPLNPGTRLGAYEVVSPLGAGGMGEVYRARDTKLGREVALKILPEAFATDPERLARFEREAQLLAALNHPHIATLHGFEQAAGSQFLVMELVEGQTLAQRIAEGPVPIDEALTIARQIADALVTAHDKGIIHRDLKPSNVALTADGRVKVLDFGLAKLNDPNDPDDPNVPHAVTMSPTLSLAATQAGAILGTAAYMAPEQAKGRPADRRSDMWAFGCVLYETLVGKPAFEGEDLTDIIGAVVRLLRRQQSAEEGRDYRRPRGDDHAGRRQRASRRRLGTGWHHRLRDKRPYRTAAGSSGGRYSCCPDEA